MEFLTVLIVLGLLQLWGSGEPLQRDRWFILLCDRTFHKVGNLRLKLLLAVGLPVLAMAILQWLVEPLLFGLLSLALYVVVLVYSLGRGDFSRNMELYLERWNRGDLEGAYHQAINIGDFIQGDAVGDHVELHEQVRRAFLYQGFERWFVVVFWFLVLGPAAALGYRLSYLCARNTVLEGDGQQLALRFVHYLDWVPVRLLAFAFSLTGNFVSGFSQWSKTVKENLPASELLDQSGRAALSEGSGLSHYPEDRERFIEFASDELHAVQALLSRSVICWLIVIALLQFIG